jgi:hypothetical protein
MTPLCSPGGLPGRYGLLAGGVDGDAVLELDDLAAAAGGRAPGAARANLAGGTAERRARAACGDVVGILTTAGEACVMEKPSLPALSQVRGLTARTSLVGGTGLEPVTCRL